MGVEIVHLSHDMLQQRVSMTMCFKDLNGTVKDTIEMQFRMPFDIRDTEEHLKEKALQQAKRLLRTAHDEVLTLA